MKAHKTVTSVQEQACGVLKCLAVNADNKVKIAGAGGIEVLSSLALLV